MSAKIIIAGPVTEGAADKNTILGLKGRLLCKVHAVFCPLDRDGNPLITPHADDRMRLFSNQCIYLSP